MCNCLKRTKSFLLVINNTTAVKQSQFECHMGGGYFTKFSDAGFSMRKKVDPINQITVFAKMIGQKGLKSMKDGVNWIENQGED